MKLFAQLLFALSLAFTANSFACGNGSHGGGDHSGGNHGQHGGGSHQDEHQKLCPIYFKTADVCAQVEFTKGPFDGTESQFLVKFFDHKSAHGEHVMVDPQNLKIDLWMYMGNHGGHGSAPVKVVKQDQGVYYVSEVYFVMPGRWNVRFFVNGEQSDLLVDVKP